MRRLVVIAMFVLPLATFGQQHGIYSQYIFNLFGVNPAYAGELDALSTSLSYRTQWVGFEGAPVTQSFSAHTPLPNKNMALGLQVQNDEIGARKTPSMSVAYAYKLKLGNKRKISMGLQAGIINYQYRWQDLNYRNEDEPVAYGTDGNKWIPNFDFGIMYIDPDKYVGFSVTSMNQAEIIKSEFSEASLGTFYNVVAGRVWEISEVLSLKPSTIIRKSKEGPLQFDLNFGAKIKNKFWLTTSYRYQFGFVFSGHFYINEHFHFGYAYDLPTNELLAEQSGTHEIFIGYEFNIFKTQSRKSRQY